MLQIKNDFINGYKIFIFAFPEMVNITTLTTKQCEGFHERAPSTPL
jgi:hypothetical protein